MPRSRRPFFLAVSVVLSVLIGAGALVLWKLGVLGGGIRDGIERSDSIIGSAEGNFFHINSGVVEAQVSDKNDALELLEEMGPSIGVSDARSTLSDPEVQSGLSNSFYRFGQTYEGIPVYGRSVVVGANEKGDVIGVTGNYRSIEGLGTTPALSSDDAVRAVGAAHEGITATCLGLCVYSLGDVTPTLVWQLDTGNSSTPTRYFVDASTGEIVAEEELYDSLASITATDINGDDVVIDVQGNEDGTVSLIDESRNVRAYFGDDKVIDWAQGFFDDELNEFRYVEEDEEGYWFEDESGQRLVARKGDWIDDDICDLFDENGNVIARNVKSTAWPRLASNREGALVPFSGEPSVFQDGRYANLVTLYSHLADVIDYYRDTLNRDGFSERGGTLHLVSDASFDDWNVSKSDKNAFTASKIYGAVIAYGRDLPVSRVVVGHEFTHAVITNILGENGGSGIESGALSEAICDLTGIAIEDYCNDGQFDNDAQWEIPQMRNIAEPHNSNGGKKHLPTSYGDENWKNGQIEAHDASTVISHAGYLMCCDDSLEGDSLTTEQLSQLVYVTLFSLPTDCNFSQFRVIMENACTAMVDQGLLDPAQRTRVSAAFDKVNVQRSVSLYGLTRDATLQVFDVNNQPYGDYVAYVGPYRENYMPSPGEEDVYTITPASSDPVSLNFPRAGKYQIVVANFEGLSEGEKPYEYWDVSVVVYDSWMFWGNKHDQIKIYTNFAEFDEENPQGEAIDSITNFDEPPVKTADDFFLEKIEELESTYGESRVSVTEASSAQGGYYYGYASGLAFAELIDFGDGVERLVVIYYGGDDQEAPKYSDYYLQVWEYDDEANGLRCVYGENGSAPLMDGTLEESLVDYSSSLTIYSTKDASVLNYGYTISFSSTQAYVGIAENGSFGLIHSIETVGDLVGTRVVRRYLVDGVEVSDEEFQDIQKSMGIVSNDVTPRWCHLIGSYTSESEAKGGMKPSNSVEQNNSEFYVYPREMVQQVEDTKKLLQDRIGGRGSAQDDADAEAVVAREITETVEVPTFYTGYDKSDGTERHTWGYLEITEGASDDVLSAINETLHDEYEDVKGGSVDKSESNTGEGDCTVYRSLLTCGRDGFLGMCVMQYRTNWGAHGWIGASGHIYDLSSGEELEPWEVTGMSKSELDNAAVEAVASYAMNNPGNIVYTSEAEAQNDVREVLSSCEYLLTNDGIVISLSPYAMGYPYQDITSKIVVWAFDDPSLVGTNVADQFNLDFWD